MSAFFLYEVSNMPFNGHKKRKTSDKGALALRKVNRLLKTRESKAFYAAGELLNAKTVVSLAEVVQGEQASERDGNQVTAKKLEIALTIRATNLEGLDGPQVMEVALVLDRRQQVGMLPNFDDVWLGAIETGFQTRNDFRDRFVILRKKRVILYPTALTANSTVEYTAANFDWDVKFKSGLNLQWEGASGTTWVGNGLYLTYDAFAYDSEEFASIKASYGSKLSFTDA